MTLLQENTKKVVLDSKCKPHIITFSLYNQLLLVENIAETKVDVTKSCILTAKVYRVYDSLMGFIGYWLDVVPTTESFSI